MSLTPYTKKLLALAETVYRWLGALTALDPERRARVAKYADAIADTLARAIEAHAKLEEHPGNKAAQRAVSRELARIAGYVETIVSVLEHQLDGRKLAGVKRRLEQLAPPPSATATASSTPQMMKSRMERLISAEGYFRALSDGLRA